MNKQFFLSLIFCCQLAFAQCSYESRVEYLWNKVAYERQIDTQMGYLPKDVKQFLTDAAQEMGEGEHLLLAFYPRDCGFDYLVQEKKGFTKVKEFFARTQELGFKIHFCCPQRHLAEFETREELEGFVKKTFQTKLSREEPPLRFPTKIILVELIKVV